MLDVSLDSNKHRFCNGWSRRDFLRLGALSPIGLSLGGLLSFEKLARGEAGVPRRAREVRDPRLSRWRHFASRHL